MMGQGKALKAIRGTGSKPDPQHAVWEGGQLEARGTEPISMTWPQCCRREAIIGHRLIILGGNEHRLLCALLFNHRWLSNDELIEAVWPDPDFEPDMAYNQIKVHISRLRHVKGIGIVTKYGGARLAERHRFG